MSRWVGEESRAGRTGNSAERELEGAMEWKLSCPTEPSPLSAVLRGLSVDPRHLKYSQAWLFRLSPASLWLTQLSSCPRIPYLSHLNPQEWVQSLQGEWWEGKSKPRVEALGPGSNCTVMSDSIVNPTSIGVYYVLSTVLRLGIKKWITSAIKKLWGQLGICNH